MPDLPDDLAHIATLCRCAMRSAAIVSILLTQQGRDAAILVRALREAETARDAAMAAIDRLTTLGSGNDFEIPVAITVQQDPPTPELDSLLLVYLLEEAREVALRIERVMARATAANVPIENIP